MEKVFVRNPYNYDRDKVSNETGLACEDASLTQQHQKDDADINTIVRRFGLTGELPSNLRLPQYGDFIGIASYHDAMNKVLAAQAEFMKLPADLRAKFENSPEQFVEFCSDPENKEELIKMGLAVRRERVATEQATPAEESPATEPQAKEKAKKEPSET